MNHYEVLGVAPDVGAAELRRRYLDLARLHHPDVVGSHGGGEERMRAINAAWAVLGDADRRARYDEDLRRADAAAGPAARGPASGPVRRSTFRPLDDDESWDVHDERFDKLGVGDDLTDESLGTGARPPRFLAVLPAALFVLGVAALVPGFVASFGPLLVLGLVALVLSGIAFVATPLVAIFLSRSSER